MQAPNAQGIMGLMPQGRAPQGAPQPQQPMPSPMKASPMAGLGSVEDRVAAYRGNPAPLQQRYQMSQDLLDLLALQKIKSEKDAAARQMQLAMSQHQEAQGMEPQTIAQQREKEVMDMTKNELAEQRGDTAQHQAEQQQETMKRVLSGGIAAAPGAATAAQPKAMAAGGIVAFDDGGDVPEATSTEDEDMPDWARALRAKRLRDQELARRQLEAERTRNMRVVNEEDANLRPAMANDPRILGATPPEETVGATPAQMAPAPRPAPRPAPAPTQGAPAPMPRPAPTAAPAGIAGLPGAAAAPATAGFGKTLQGLVLKQAGRDSTKAGQDEETRIENKLAIDPAQQKAMDEANAFRKRMFEEQYDPERQRMEGIRQFLAGAGGRRYNVLGSGAQAAQAYDKEQRAAKLKEFEDLQKGIMEPFAMKRGILEKGVAAGQSASKLASEEGRTALTSGANLYGTDVNAAVERMKAHINAEANRIQREGLDQTRALAAISNAEKWIATEIRKIEEGMLKDPKIGMLMMKPSDKLTPDEKNELEAAQIRVKQAQNVIQKKMEPVLAANRAKLGITSTNLSPEDEKLVNSYLKGK